MSDQALAEGIKCQFTQAYDVLEAAVVQFTPEEWIRGNPPFDGPARGTVHALLCAEFYTSQDDSVWGRFGKPLWQATPEELPSLEAVREYLELVREMTTAWIDKLAAAGLASKADDFHQTGLESMLYALRHLQHHTGEVCVYLKQAGHPQEQWA